MIGSTTLKHAIPFLAVLLLPQSGAVFARDFHVATQGSDANPGTRIAPLHTIQRAADLAQPGDFITVHEGVYRERVNPPLGGTSDRKRIVYQAAPGERVEIKGSEVVTNWVRFQGDVWLATLPNSFFGNFNPYNDLLRGDWFNALGRKHHSGAVYLNGEWLTEATNLTAVVDGAEALWFAVVDATNTTIWARFAGVNPNEQLTEINVRRTVFYPDQPGRNFITVRGFTMRQAATPFAPPTAEQVGLLGTHWSKGWIIESNTISHSICVGITLGKYGDEFDNTTADTAEGYVKTIQRALADGKWTRENIGHHIVRNNQISHCEQGGIAGSMGGAFSTITGNVIHDIWVRRLFSGGEMAGIKFHGAIDSVINHNHVYRAGRGIWLDWMTQGTRVTSNLLHDNSEYDLFVEVNHGPFLVDNNLLLSKTSLHSLSQGGAYAHNLFAGRVAIDAYNSRVTPFHKAHSTEIAGMAENSSGDDRLYNNLVVERGDLTSYDQARLPLRMNGNVYLKNTKPTKHDAQALLKPEFDPALKLIEQSDGIYLEMALDEAWRNERPRKLVTTELLGRAVIPNLPYEQPDGSPLKINSDYFGKKRSKSNPAPGPFEITGAGTQKFKVW